MLLTKLQDECKRVSTEGQSLRLDMSTKFQDAIKVGVKFSVCFMTYSCLQVLLDHLLNIFFDSVWKRSCEYT